MSLFGKRKWEVRAVSYGGNEWHLILEDGTWEPFAVSPSGDQYATIPAIVWFRRQQ